MPPNRFESEVESFLEGSHGDRTHNKQRADHHTVTPLCGTLLVGFSGCCSGVSKGDGGFTVACVSGCSGVVGFKAATWLCPEREKVRPARLKRPKTLFSGALGELFRG